MRNLVHTVWLLAIGICLPFSPLAQAKDCGAYFRLVKVASTAGRGGLAVTKHAAKTNFYPAVIATKTLAHAYQWTRGRTEDRFLTQLGKTLHKDKWHLLGYFSLLALQRTTGITHAEFEAETPEFLELTPEDVVVVVDAFPEDDLAYNGAAKYIYEARYKKHPSGAKAHFVKARNSVELLQKLGEISKKHKISRLDYYGHGLPGMLVNGANGGENTDSLYQIASAVKRADDPAMRVDAQEIMAAGGMIRFNTCFSMNGVRKDGSTESAARMMGRVFFENHPNGGIVYGSKVQILPNYLEMITLKANLPEPPAWARKTADYLSVGNGVLTFAGAINLHFFDNDGIMEGVFHRDRVSKVWVPHYSYLYDNFDAKLKTLWDSHQNLQTLHPEFRWDGEPLRDFIGDRAYARAKAKYLSEGGTRPFDEKERWLMFNSIGSVYSSDLRSVNVTVKEEDWEAFQQFVQKDPKLKLLPSSRSQTPGEKHIGVINTAITFPKGMREKLVSENRAHLKALTEGYQHQTEVLFREETERLKKGEISADVLAMRKQTIQDHVDEKLRIITFNLNRELETIRQ